MSMPALDMEPDPVPSKPPPASLISIAAKGKPAAPNKAGDLTRLFELARQETAPSLPPVAEPTHEPVVTAAEPVASEPPAPMADEVEWTISDPAPEPEVSTVVPFASPMMDFSSDPVISIDRDYGEHSVEIEASELVEAPLPIETPAPVEEPAMLEALPAIEPTPAEEIPIAAPIAFAPADPPMAAKAPMAIEPVSAPVIEIEPPVETPSPIAVEAPAVVAPVAAPEPAPAETPTAPAFARLADYWHSLRGTQDYPATEALDHALVTERWPGSLVIAFTPASEDVRGEPRPARVTRLGTACAATRDAVDYGSYATEWMLELARAALMSGSGVEEMQRLQTRAGAAGFRLVALPLGRMDHDPDSVLCELVPSPAAPRFGKRRTWLQD